MEKLNFTPSYLSQFKIVKSKTLFDPSKEDITKALKERKCIYCGRRLYINRQGTIWRCKSKTSNDKFVVRNEVLTKYI